MEEGWPNFCLLPQAIQSIIKPRPCSSEIPPICSILPPCLDPGHLPFFPGCLQQPLCIFPTSNLEPFVQSIFTQQPERPFKSSNLLKSFHSSLLPLGIKFNPFDVAFQAPPSTHHSLSHSLPCMYSVTHPSGPSFSSWNPSSSRTSQPLHHRSLLLRKPVPTSLG